MTLNIVIKVILIFLSVYTWGQVNLMMLALKSGPQIAAKVGNPAGLLCRRIWYSVVKSGVLGITEYRQGRPLSSQINRLEGIQHYAARFVANDHRRTTSPTTLVLTLNWQTLERRRTIKQAMTFYKILNNIIEIDPPTGLLTRSHNRHHFTIPRS